MVERNGDLRVHPLFYDALSGQFYPYESDVAHSLSRLMVATFQKCESFSDIHIHDTDSHVGLNYTPSWADRVNATVIWEMDEEATVLKGLRLVEDVRCLDIYHHAPDEDNTNMLWLSYRNIILDGAFVQGHFGIALGAELERSRDVVTKQAQAFFSQPKKKAD